MFDMKANNVKVGDKLIDTQDRVWTISSVDSDPDYPYILRHISTDVVFSASHQGEEWIGESSLRDIVGLAPGHGSQTTANKPHKHKDLIIAWANGAEIEFYSPTDNEWYGISNPDWYEHMQYRIKPEPKPDVVKYMGLETSERNGENTWLSDELSVVQNWKHTIKLTFCGETGKLKSAEVIS